MRSHDERWNDFREEVMPPGIPTTSSPYKAMRHAYACGAFNVITDLLEHAQAHPPESLTDPTESVLIQMGAALREIGAVLGIDVKIEIEKAKPH